jgi:hypothetical protein
VRTEKTYYIYFKLFNMNNNEVPDYGLDDRYHIEAGLRAHQGLFVQSKVVGAWSSPLQSKAKVRNNVFMGST